MNCKVNVVCETCSTTFRIYRSTAAQKPRRYCSRKCDPHFSHTRAKCKCKQCGGVFKVHPYRTKQECSLCSEACKIRWLSVTFSGSNSPHWKGGRTKYGPNWKIQRAKARNRDGHKCTHCGKTEEELGEALSVAHIIAFRDFGMSRYKEANALSNLKSLCRLCHIRFDWSNGHRS